MANAVVQFLNGLAGASSLFLVAAGLSLIFGVSRVVNFAHGSLYMLGMYLAWSLAGHFGRGSFLGFWAAVVCAALAVGLIGAALEVLVLRRVYRAPEMFQLLATFALVLVAKDAALWIWGAEDLLGPRAPGLRGAVEILGRRVPEYDLFLVVVGPVVLVLLWLLVNRTRWGMLVRAASENREMAGALGVDQAKLFTGVFFLGAFLAGLGGALQLPREPASLGVDLPVVADAFVVVVVGGLGSVGGAFLAALLIALAKALCIALGDVEIAGMVVSFSKLTLAVEFVVMAIVLVVRPWGLAGRAPVEPHGAAAAHPALRAPGPLFWPTAGMGLMVLAFVPLGGEGYTLVLLIDIAIFALFAASLHFLMGPAGLVSFGHAAYFGLGAYAAALVFLKLGWPFPAALAAAVVAGGVAAALFGWFCVRLSGVYLAMLTLAFAQIAWSVVHQWDGLTGGSNGLVGVWPPGDLKSRTLFFWIVLGLSAAGVMLLWRMVHSPFGLALRAARDSALRAEAVGIDVRRLRWIAFVAAGALAGLAGGLFAFSKGSVSPEALGVARSVDGLAMVLLGGVHSLTGPVAGAAVFTLLQDEIARASDYWRAALGAAILVLVLAFPNGLAGAFATRRLRGRGQP